MRKQLGTEVLMKQRKINEVHSLYNLWENFKHLNRSNRLVPCYSPNQEQAIDRVILFLMIKILILQHLGILLVNKANR